MLTLSMFNYLIRYSGSQYFSLTQEELDALSSQGLIQFTETHINVTPLGKKCIQEGVDCAAEYLSQQNK